MLKGRSAIVTGSTSGIGLAIAHALCAEGANVALNGFGEAGTIEKMRAELVARHGVKVIYSPADMRKPAEIRELVADAVAAFGAVDILVNNAGIQHVEAIETFPEDKWDAIMAVNLTAAFHSIKAVVPRMKKAGWGRIVNIASAHGLVASRFKSAYVSAKHGLVGLGKTVALETAEHGITCNSICPGYVMTPLVQQQITDQATAHGIPPEKVVRDVLLVEQPTRRFVETTELGLLVVFLCSDAARSITGAALSVDGGWIAH